MELVRNIRIKHFKSLEDVEIKGCKRYNLTLEERVSLCRGGKNFSIVDLKVERAATEYPIFKPYYYGKITGADNSGPAFLSRN